MSTWRHRAVRVLLIIVLAGGGTATAAPVATLSVANDSDSICNVPMWVGAAKGIFQRHGLDIRMHSATNGFAALREVDDGFAQIGAAAPTVFLQFLSQGARLKGILVGCGDATGSMATDNIVEIVARRTAAVREGHVEDLRGKRIGLGGRGTVNHQYLFAALAAKGLDPARDVSLVIAPPAELARLLGNGGVDAVATSIVAAAALVRTVPDTIVVQRGGNVLQYVILRIVRADYLATHPGTIKRYITAFAEAAQYARLHPEETTDVLMADGRGASRESVRAALASLDPDMRISGATVRAVRQKLRVCGTDRSRGAGDVARRNVGQPAVAPSPIGAAGPLPRPSANS